MEDPLSQAVVRVVGVFVSDAGGTLELLGQGPLRDTELAEEAATAGDTVWVLGDQLGGRVGGMEGRREHH